MLTIREFADAIGVSPSTVSRTLNGSGRISHATRKMVMERMKELGYTPNINAQRLNSGRANMVALDFGVNQHLLSDMYFCEVTRGIQRALRKEGFGLLLNDSADTLRRWVDSKAVDAVMMVGGDPDEEANVRRMAADGTPCVLISHCPVNPEPYFTSVITDLTSGAREVAQTLVEKGHRRIGFLGSYEDDLVLEGFRARLAELNTPLRPEYIRFAGPDPDRVPEELKALLSLPEVPTAVFARTDVLAAAVLRTARQWGVRVPQELSVIGHDDIAFANLTEPALTTVRIDCVRMGELAAEALCLLLNSSGYTVRPRVIQGRLVVRDTVARPGGAAEYDEEPRSIAPAGATVTFAAR